MEIIPERQNSFQTAGFTLGSVEEKWHSLSVMSSVDLVKSYTSSVSQFVQTTVLKLAVVTAVVTSYCFMIRAVCTLNAWICFLAWVHRYT